MRTLQRWKATDGLEVGDRRPGAVHPRPAHALTEAERTEILAVVNQARFADMPPARIVPMLADEGRYLTSESSVPACCANTANNRIVAGPACLTPVGRRARIATAPGHV